MKKSKRVLASILASMLTMTALAGCGGTGGNNGSADSGSADSGEKTELKFLITAGNDEMPGWQGIVDSFNEKSEDSQITLEQLPGSWTEYIQKLTALIAADTAPDIGRVAPTYLPQFVEKDQVLDLDDYVSTLDMENYYESAFEQVKIQGKTYGIPVGVYTLVLYYNKVLFDEAGVEYPSSDWENPWTLEEFQDAAAKLTKGDGADKQYGFYAQTSPERSGGFVLSAGGDIYDSDRSTPSFNTEPVIKTYQMVQDMINQGISPTPTMVETMPIDQMFTSNKLAMFIEGQWMMPSITKDESFEFGVAPVPQDETATTLNFIDQYVIFKASKHHDETWEAVKSFIEGDAEKIMVENNLGGIPVYKPTVEEMFDQLFNPLTDDEKNVIINSIDHSQALTVSNTWAEDLDTATKTLDLIALDQMTVEDGMAQIDKDIAALRE